MHFYRAKAALLSDTLGRAGVDGAERRALIAARLSTITYDEALLGSVLIGTPDSVSEQIRALRDDLGLDGIMLEMNCGGKILCRREQEALRLLCQDVMPRFR
jgi:alkanesulfonate monooxygenase SsuD/methylene tetrahydromethanopterin reductase-like flavin-dependent oxidoreductase (luciferase family)